MFKLNRHERKLFCSTIFLLGFIVISSAGCSVYMAANQPGEKNLGVLNPGTPRMEVIAELGPPAFSEEKNGNKVDLFNFKQGYGGGAKAGRALFHGAADVVTLGLWEIVGTPTESYASGTDMSVEVQYDTEDKVKTYTILKNGNDSKEEIKQTEANNEE